MEIPHKYKIKAFVVDYIKSVPDEVPDLGIGRMHPIGSERARAMAITLYNLLSKN